MSHKSARVTIPIQILEDYPACCSIFCKYLHENENHRNTYHCTLFHINDSDTFTPLTKSKSSKAPERCRECLQSESNY